MTTITKLCMLNRKTDIFVSSQRHNTCNLTHIKQIIPTLGGLCSKSFREFAAISSACSTPSAKGLFLLKSKYIA